MMYPQQQFQFLTMLEEVFQLMLLFSLQLDITTTTIETVY